jgi:hypothetical protein
MPLVITSIFKSKLAPKVKMMVMVKALVGNGGLEIAKLLEHQSRLFRCSFADEGISLKNGGIKLLSWC